MSKNRLFLAIIAIAIFVALTDTAVRLLIIPISSISNQAGIYSIVAYVLSVFVIPGFIAGYGPERKPFFAGALSGLIGGALGFIIIKALEAVAPPHISANEFSTAIFGSFMAAIAACCGAYIHGRKRSNNSFKADGLQPRP